MRLQRLRTSDKFAMRGVLSIPGIVTLELPWKDNQRGVSCIPPGAYTAERYFSPHHGYDVFRLTNVPGRDDVELHIGNLPKDSQGCILLGSLFGDVYTHDATGEHCLPGILDSHVAFVKFMDAMSAVTSFPFTVAAPPAP